LKEPLTLRDLVEDYGLDEEEGERILKLLVTKGLARWIDFDRVGWKRISKYVKELEKRQKEKTII